MPHEQSRIAASDAKKSAVAAISGEADARCVKARAKFIFCDVTKTLAKWAVIGAPAPKTMEVRSSCRCYASSQSVHVCEKVPFWLERQALCQAAKLERCDYLALGAYGRKGEQLEHMGSTAESALFLLTGIVTMTVKNQCTVPELSAPKVPIPDASRSGGPALKLSAAKLGRPGLSGFAEVFSVLGRRSRIEKGTRAGAALP